MILGRKSLRAKRGSSSIPSVAWRVFSVLRLPEVERCHSRLHLPFFVLSAPFVAAALFNVKDSRLGLSGGLEHDRFDGHGDPHPPLLLREAAARRALMLRKQRNERYFWFPHRKEPFMNAQQFLKDRKLNAVGFVGADWEYPMMVLLREDHPDVRFLR